MSIHLLGSNTCQNIQCHDGKVCLTDPATNSPRCSSCTNVPCNSSIDHQVCGTDGKTYKNWCVMHQQACTTRKVIDLYHSGRCKGMIIFSTIYYRQWT